MPDRNRNRCQQKGVREAVAAGRYHEIQNKRVVQQADENGKLKAEPFGKAAAQKITDTNVQGRAQQRWHANREYRYPEDVRCNPDQQGIEDVVIRAWRPWIVCANPPEVCVRFIDSNRLQICADNRQREDEKGGYYQRRLLPDATIDTYCQKGVSNTLNVYELADRRHQRGGDSRRDPT
jgi:hypothetical protein